MSRRVATVVALTALVLSIGASPASADMHNTTQEASCQGGRAAPEGLLGEDYSQNHAGPGFGDVIANAPQGAKEKCSIATGRPPEEGLPPLFPYRTH